MSTAFASTIRAVSTVLFVSGACPVEAQTLAVGCLSKPYTDKMLKAALEALDRKLSGDQLKKLPAGLSLYAKPERGS